MATATLTSKGQITIPLDVRQRLKLEAGARVEFVESAEGEFLMRPAVADVRSLKGLLRKPANTQAIVPKSHKITSLGRTRWSDAPAAAKRTCWSVTSRRIIPRSRERPQRSSNGNAARPSPASSASWYWPSWCGWPRAAIRPRARSSARSFAASWKRANWQCRTRRLYGRRCACLNRARPILLIVWSSAPPGRPVVCGP